MREMFIDIETYSSVDLIEAGVYKYVESSDFEILLIGYAINSGPIQIIDLASGDKITNTFLDLINDPKTIKIAHNAMFERLSFKQYGFNIPIHEWRCTMIKAAYMGLPFSLAQVAKVLTLESQKLDSGTALIKYFSMPCKPTIINGKRTRNLPQHDAIKWTNFINYLIADVETCREIHKRLNMYDLSAFDSELYVLDQNINDTGIGVDTTFAENAIRLDEYNTNRLKTELLTLTGLENPNSVAQLKKWLGMRLNETITTLAKDNVTQLLKDVEDHSVRRVLELRQELGKTSIAKYRAMINSEVEGVIRGLLQFYGANATGRWAGRLVQVHNLPRNSIYDLQFAHECVAECNYDLLDLSFNNISSVLSQLIRTAFKAKRSKDKLVVADFNSIESRVISWYAGEEWRLEIFRTHGKIYEATASKLFNVPFESVTKDSVYRQQGKIAELALGFGGSIGALTQMDSKNEISDDDKPELVRIWRRANPKITSLWNKINNAAIACVEQARTIILTLPYTKLKFSYNGEVFSIELPSGHILNYWHPKIKPSKFGSPGLTYMSLKQGQWIREDTYGGKLVENIVQATARDLLGTSMLRIHDSGYKISMHVHDEIVCEAHEDEAEQQLKHMLDIMGTSVLWAPGLPICAAGFISDYYKKD